MPTSTKAAFAPRFRYTHGMVNHLGGIEGARAFIELLSLPPDGALRLTYEARRRSSRASLAIEGTNLSEHQVRQAVAARTPAASRGEQEVRNYWRALDRVDEFAREGRPITEAFIQELHRIVIVRGPGRRGSRSSYRTTECPVVDTLTRQIDYGPPVPADVPGLMTSLVGWLQSDQAAELSTPLRAGVLAHRFMSIHPFDDGNGRTGRLLATAELWRSGYSMRGFLSFDEHFDADRERYYASLQMGLPVDYYQGRHDPDHTIWLEYFVAILSQAAGRLQEQARQLHRAVDLSSPWDALPRLQQQVLTRLLNRILAGDPDPLELRVSDAEEWFGVSPATARQWLSSWGAEGFLDPVLSGQGQRVRRYRLGSPWVTVLDKIRETMEPK